MTRDDVVARRCELISLFSVHILFSETLVVYYRISEIPDTDGILADNKNTIDSSYLIRRIRLSLGRALVPILLAHSC